MLEYSLTIPEYEAGTDAMTCMARSLIPAVRECLNSAEWATKVTERESDGNFLVGFAGKLFIIYEDYQVMETRNSYGGRQEFAREAMYSNVQLSQYDRVTQALACVAHNSTAVAESFTVISG